MLIQISAGTTGDGTRPMEAAKQPLDDLQQQRTELLRQNEELRNSLATIATHLARYTDLYDYAPVGYLTLTSEGEIVQLNCVAAALLDQTPTQATGCSFVAFVHDEDRGKFTDLLARVFATNDPQHCVLRLSVAARMVQIETASKDNRRNCRMVVFDVSTRVHADAQRSAQDAQLRESQRLKGLSTLAGGIAHQFNNILGSINGNLMLASCCCDVAHPVHISLREIKKASSRAQRLVDQILSFSRRRPQLLLEQSLQPVVNAAWRLMQTGQPTNLSFTMRAWPSELLTRIDAAQIQQVLVNVIDNACEAMPSSGGEVHIELSEIDLGVTENIDGEPNHYASILISDTGHGMDEVTLSQIYEPFFTTKSPDKGVGLGLAVAYGIMKDHGGSIRLRSTSSAGTTFELRLPIVSRPSAAAPAPTRAPPPVTTTAPHVLYLDDDEPMVYMVHRLLQKLGHKVSSYERSDEALRALRSDPQSFDLVVTDFNMPGPSGLDVARDVAQIRPDLPVVITTGHITDQLREGARLIGVRHLIYKPNTVEELCQSIQRILLGT